MLTVIRALVCAISLLLASTAGADEITVTYDLSDSTLCRKLPQAFEFPTVCASLVPQGPYSGQAKIRFNANVTATAASGDFATNPPTAATVLTGPATLLSLNLTGGAATLNQTSTVMGSLVRSTATFYGYGPFVFSRFVFPGSLTGYAPSFSFTFSGFTSTAPAYTFALTAPILAGGGYQFQTTPTFAVLPGPTLNGGSPAAIAAGSWQGQYIMSPSIFTGTVQMGAAAGQEIARTYKVPEPGVAIGVAAGALLLAGLGRMRGGTS